jgi:3-deoxy-D-manno-octulosonic-acid transferase
MKVIYNAVIYLIILVARLASPFNKKVKQWRAGTADWRSLTTIKTERSGKRIWIHCASLGEFEQGRPLVEAIRKMDQDAAITLSFFSPSGYEIRKNYNKADAVCYLPPDTSRNAREFISKVNPDLVIFVKYEFWYNYTRELQKKGIKLYLISGIFREGQHFFRSYGGFFRGILRFFTWFFVQDDSSAQLLKSIGFKNVTVAGDTRFDRVLEIAAASRELHVLRDFRGEEKLFLAGSSWEPDEKIMARYIKAYPERLKWVFAPHEIGEDNIKRLENLFGDLKTARYSRYTGADRNARVLIIDNIGMLSSAYSYAWVAAVGGGFGKGIHNILEPACWGIPVMFGPAHKKFREAGTLLEAGGAGTYSDYETFAKILDGWFTDEDSYRKAALAAGDFVRKNAGATQKIISAIP